MSKGVVARLSGDGPGRAGLAGLSGQRAPWIRPVAVRCDQPSKAGAKGSQDRTARALLPSPCSPPNSPGTPEPGSVFKKQTHAHFMHEIKLSYPGNEEMRDSLRGRVFVLLLFGCSVCFTISGKKNFRTSRGNLLWVIFPHGN